MAVRTLRDAGEGFAGALGEPADQSSRSSSGTTLSWTS
jgi:hypothetical protein